MGSSGSKNEEWLKKFQPLTIAIVQLMN
jgi:hypothetical protein